MLTKEAIEEWVSRYIDTFRGWQATADLSAYRVSNLDDFSTPVQVLVVSIAPPLRGVEPSLLLCYHIEGEQDRAIDVVGPLPPEEAISQVELLLSKERWGRKIETKEFLIPEGEEELRFSVARSVAQMLRSFDRYLVDRAYGRPAPRLGFWLRMILPFRGFMWELAGDFTSLDVDELVRNSIETIPLPQPTPKPQDEKGHRQASEYAKGYGALFYPPVWIGKRPVQSMGEIMRRVEHNSVWRRQVVLRGTYLGHNIWVYDNGLLAIGTDDRQKALTCLNQIMAYAWLIDAAPVLALRDSELWDLRIDLQNPSSMSSSTSGSSLRNLPAFGRSDPTHLEALYPVISIEKMQEVLAGAEAIAQMEHLNFSSLFCHEAYTSLHESNYRKAFVDGWVVVERWVHLHWRDALTAKGRTKADIRKLEDQPDWTAAVKAETLELMGIIDKQCLEDITKWRRLRNKVVHDGHTPSKEESEGMIEFALKLFRESLRQQTDVAAFQHTR